MSLLFYLDKSNKAILHREVINLVPSLSILKDEEVLYVILYADYNSPYRQFPEYDRKNKAMWHAFGDNEADLVESDKILIAVQDYISLQYSPKIKAAEEYQKKIDSLLDEMQVEKSPKKLKEYDDAIDICRKRIRMFEHEYELDLQKQGVIKGKMELGHLEKLMSNMKNFHAVTSQEIKMK